MPSSMVYPVKILTQQHLLIFSSPSPSLSHTLFFSVCAFHLHSLFPLHLSFLFLPTRSLVSLFHDDRTALSIPHPLFHFLEQVFLDFFKPSLTFPKRERLENSTFHPVDRFN